MSGRKRIRRLRQGIRAGYDSVESFRREFPDVESAYSDEQIREMINTDQREHQRAEVARQNKNLEDEMKKYQSNQQRLRQELQNQYGLEAEVKRGRVFHDIYDPFTSPSAKAAIDYVQKQKLKEEVMQELAKEKMLKKMFSKPRTKARSRSRSKPRAKSRTKTKSKGKKKSK